MSGSSSRPTRLFAVVPAAGHSRRMGRPKLLLPVGGQSVVRRLIEALDHPEVAETFVVVRRDDRLLVEEVDRCGARVVLPQVDPPDMRASVQAGLDAIEAEHQPRERDGWLLVPADHPVLNGEVVASLVDAWQQTSADVLLPTHDGRRGHPTVFRWSLTERVRQLPADSGLNAIVRDPETKVAEVPVGDPSILVDLDTPDDYQRLVSRPS